jgi:type I restriction-modification system DNA methylase subunit
MLILHLICPTGAGSACVKMQGGNTEQIPVCLWFLVRNKKNGRFKDRRGKTLFIDARKMGSLVDRIHKELSDENIARIASTYHAWRGDVGANHDSPLPLEESIKNNLKELGF